VNIVLYFSSNKTVSWNSPPPTPPWVYPHNTDCCYFLGWLTTPWNKEFPGAFITLSWAVSQTGTFPGLAQNSFESGRQPCAVFHNSLVKSRKISRTIGRKRLNSKENKRVLQIQKFFRVKG
jgi:hypothetical protein